MFSLAARRPAYLICMAFAVVSLTYLILNYNLLTVEMDEAGGDVNQAGVLWCYDSGCSRLGKTYFENYPGRNTYHFLVPEDAFVITIVAAEKPADFVINGITLSKFLTLKRWDGQNGFTGWVVVSKDTRGTVTPDGVRVSSEKSPPAISAVPALDAKRLWHVKLWLFGLPAALLCGGYGIGRFAKNALSKRPGVAARRGLNAFIEKTRQARARVSTGRITGGRIAGLAAYITAQRVFLLLGPVFGLAMLLITPPFQAPDEINHFYRAFKLSEGEIVPRISGMGVGGYVPESSWRSADALDYIKFDQQKKTDVRTIQSLLKIPLDEGKRVFEDFLVQALYFPLMYAPQTAGIFIGRMAGLSPIAEMYAGRLANFLTWALPVYLAIRIAPFAKWLFLFVAMAPMSVSQAASLSPDAFVNAASLVFVALALKLSQRNSGPITAREMILFVLLSTAIGISKNVYIVLLLLVFLIPRAGFGSRRRYVSFLAIYAALNAAVMGLWYYMLRDVNEFVGTHTDLNLGSKIHWIAQNPFEYLTLLVNSYAAYYRIYLTQYVGVLGHLDTFPPSLVTSSYVAAMVVVSLTGPRREFLNLNGATFGANRRLILLAAFLSGLVLVATGVFLQFPKLYGVIVGVQGRYFIPIAPLFFLLPANAIKAPNTGGMVFRAAAALYLVFSSVSTVFALINRYYSS